MKGKQLVTNVYTECHAYAQANPQCHSAYTHVSGYSRRKTYSQARASIIETNFGSQSAKMGVRRTLKIKMTL